MRSKNQSNEIKLFISQSKRPIDFGHMITHLGHEIVKECLTASPRFIRVMRIFTDIDPTSEYKYVAYLDLLRTL
jgi:hypothetical protein